ncbi:hypothetical protein ILUMI_03454 [Ignelater luminosus]|uniref:Mariner Mos1 transposase n=1 Tax=Ignelater luminosus TaxID=2038154 RepID=A0A8K0DGA9_IGNLU|nr:hypothetical protein ILUMI_03454 [Ignelater luminosus]
MTTLARDVLQLLLPKKLVTDDRHITYVKIEETLGTHTAFVHSILYEHLGLRKLCTVWVSFNQRAKGRSYVVTENETWVYHYDILTKQQAKQWVFEDETTPTVISRWYTTVRLPRVFERLKAMRPSFALRHWCLHHHNAPSHRAASDILLLEYHPCSPDLVHFVFFQN